jgi:hypothetical protein
VNDGMGRTREEVVLDVFKLPLWHLSGGTVKLRKTGLLFSEPSIDI